LGLTAVRTYLLEQLGALRNVEEHRFNHGIDTGVNLVLKLPGQQTELNPFLVGAHYDGPLQSIGAVVDLVGQWSRSANHGRVLWAGSEVSPRWPGYFEGAIEAAERAAASAETVLQGE
jgi:hypothetical protein